MTRLVVTTDAEADINDILDYLHKEAGARVATSYGRKFAAIIERLVESPGIGAPRPALGPDVRIGMVPPYVLIYAFTDGGRHLDPASRRPRQAQHHPPTDPPLIRGAPQSIPAASDTAPAGR